MSVATATSRSQVAVHWSGSSTSAVNESGNPPASSASNGSRPASVDDLEIAIVVPGYQRDTVAFAHDAAARGASLVVCTDPYLCPASAAATVLLATALDGLPPFISLAPPFTLVETLVAGVAERGGVSARERLAAFERLGSGALDG